jgi:hypothetical protein
LNPSWNELQEYPVSSTLQRTNQSKKAYECHCDTTATMFVVLSIFWLCSNSSASKTSFSLPRRQFMGRMPIAVYLYARSCVCTNQNHFSRVTDRNEEFYPEFWVSPPPTAARSSCASLFLQTSLGPTRLGALLHCDTSIRYVRDVDFERNN